MGKLTKDSIIDAVEYEDGYYRNSKIQSHETKFPCGDDSQQEAESGPTYGHILSPGARKALRALFNITSYDCLFEIVMAGIIARTIMLVIYVFTTHWLDYDLKIGFWWFLGKLFWLPIDVGLVRAWLNEIRPHLTCDGTIPSNHRVILIVRVMAWLFAGFTLKLAIIDLRLKLFFAISKVMVMGVMAFTLLLLFRRLYCVMRVMTVEEFTKMTDTKNRYS